MSESPYSAMRARLADRTVKHYLRPTFRLHNSADDSVERLRFDALLDQLPSHLTRHEPSPKTWLLTGGAGSGKSTAVQQYAIALMDRHTPCVIVDNRTIRQLDVHGLTVKEFAKQSRPSGIDEKLWKAHVKKNRVVFLVDALNELEREFDGTPEWKFTWQLVAGSHDFTVLATSRRGADDLDRTVLRDVETVAIEPLAEQDIETYLGMRDAAATEALDEIRSGDMLGVASNPFMLSLLTDWLLGTRSVKDREIPRSRADLLRETVIRPYGDGRFGKVEKDAAERGLGMEAALCAAALAAITTGKGNADFLARDVSALLTRVWDNPDDATHAVAAFLDTQMVELVGDPAEGQYTLIHPAFVDFGLALAWQKTSPPPVVLDPTYLDQCLGDWIGLQPDPDSAVLTLLEPAAKPLAPELMVDILLANRGVLGEQVRGLLWRQLGACFSMGRQTRDRLATALAGLPPSGLRDGLQRGLLRDEEAKDSQFADDIRAALWTGSLDAQSLQQLRRTRYRNKREQTPRRQDRDEALAALRRAWLRERKNPLARRQSANWLGTHGGEPDIDDLRTAMLTDQDAPVRGACASALGRIGAVQAIPALLKAAETDAAPDVRGSAANALGLIGDTLAIPALTTALTQDTESDVRGSAANALGLIGDTLAIPALTTALTQDTENNVRGSAANALGRIGSTLAIPALTTLTADTDPVVRGSAANALGLIGDTLAIPALTTLTADTDPVVRGSAANALGLIGDTLAIPALTTLTADTDPVVRGSAANALGLIGDTLAIPALTTALTQDTENNVRGSAASALGQIGAVQAIPALLKAAETDAAPDVRGSAANALGRIGSTLAIPALTTLTADTDPVVRGSAANALGLIGDALAIPALTTTLTADTDPVVRGSAANALGLIGDTLAIPALTTALTQDTDSYTRGSAANALGRIGSTLAVPALTTTLTQDTDSVVRGSAATALGRIGDVHTAEVLRTTIGNPEESLLTRRAAVGSLLHMDTGDEAWVTEVADQLNFSPSDRQGRALRGALVNLLARKEITPETKAWLVGVIYRDPDPMNRTTALEGLARAGRADPDLIKFTIAPERPRSDKRPRDTDRGVCGTAAKAVVRAAADHPAYTESLLPSVAHLLAQKDTHKSTINPPLGHLRLLPLPVAERVFTRLVELIGDRRTDNPYLDKALAESQQDLAERKQVRAEVESFASNPEAVLMGFREQRKSRFEVTAPEIDDKCHVALLTAVPVETKALFQVLDERGIATVGVQRDGRYYDVFELSSTGQAPVRVATTQATDQGGPSAAAVTRDLLSAFRPDLVFLIGVCGGFDEHGVALGDVLFAREVFDYGPEKVRPEGGGLRPQVYRTDEQVLRLVNWLHTRGRLDASLGGARLVVKDFASGEKVVAWRESELRAQLVGLSADMGGVETEAHGVMHAVWEAFKAREFVGGAVLKCVSDLGDEEMGMNKEDKQTKAALRAARVALDVAAAFRRSDG